MRNEIIMNFHISIIMPVQFKVFRMYGLRRVRDCGMLESCKLGARETCQQPACSRLLTQPSR